MAEITLTAQQEEAYDSFWKWYFNFEDNKSRPYFVLCGWAGCGKSVLINYINENLLKYQKEELAIFNKCEDINSKDSADRKDHIKKISETRKKPAVVAFTNKAVKVLKQKGIEAAKTTHMLLYKYKDTKEGELLEFERRDPEDIRLEHNLIIVDEGSMIPPRIHADLLKIKLPLLYVGDVFQLPPILTPEELESHGDDFTVLQNPDYTLTEVLRQAKGNPILHAATKVRLGGELNYFESPKIPNYKYLKSISNENYRRQLALESDVVLCGTNITVKKVNNYIRELKGYDITKYPYKEEKLVVLRNNYEKAIFNGDILISTENYNTHNIYDPIDWGDIPKIVVRLEDDDKNITIRPIFKHYLSKEDEANFKILLGIKYTIRKSKGKSIAAKFSFSQKTFMQNYGIDPNSYPFDSITEVSFGYGLSTHKAQGSEFNNVLVINESKYFRDAASKWLYTAVTRAKQKLTIVDYFFPFAR